jgi:hypothetical protein
MRASNDLRRDLLAVRRHLWFVVLVFVVSLGAAAASLLLMPPSNEARFRAGVTLSSLAPLFGPDTLPTMEDFARLATSPEALEMTSQALTEEGMDVPAEELGGKLSAEARRGQSAIDFTVNNDDSDLALTIARAWSWAFAQLAPERAPDLVREATLPYQTQLERAEDELETKRQAVADLGGTTATADDAGTTTQFGALGASYQAKAEALAAREVERSDMQNTLDVLRFAAAGGTPLSADQLRLLLAAVLPTDTPLDQSLKAEDAVAALELRLFALDSSIASLTQEVQALESTLNQRSSDLERAISELRAAEENHEVASRLAQSYQLVGDLLTVNVTILREPQLQTAGNLDWLARLGAAAAFAAVVGVLGALALGQVSGRRRRSVPASNPRPDPQAPPGSPPLPPTPKWPRATTNPHSSSRSRDWERGLSFAGTALAVILLVGVLGTMTRRRREGRRS